MSKYNAKKATRSIATEYEEQKALVEWLRIKKIMHFSNHNENNTYKQDRRYAMIAEQKAKASGKVKGVSDICVMLPNKILFIELKRKPKILKSGKLSVAHTKVSKEQQAFLDRVNMFDYAAGIVAYGWHQARDFINKELETLLPIE